MMGLDGKVVVIAGGRGGLGQAVTPKAGARPPGTHRHNIMQKLELNSIVGLVRYAIRNYIVVP